MKKINLLFLLAVTLSVTSCKKFLDINKNPNDATSATPKVMLPQTIVGTASQLNGYNSTGAQLVGYMANAGGYGGFGSSVTYSFTSSDFQARWDMYDVLEDIQQVIEASQGSPANRYYNSVARILKVHGMQKLVDQYNSVPYTEALGGLKSLTPKYDDPIAIYKDLAVQLDKAIDTINQAKADDPQKTISLNSATDPMFAGNMTQWIKFANTLKLRLMITSNGKVSFANKTFEGGFLTTDATVNPGYTRVDGKQNPKWNSWGWSATGSSGNKAWMPNTFVFGFYNGKKLLDPRGWAIYYNFATNSNNHNRLGVESNAIPSSPEGSFWYPSSQRNGRTAGGATGVLKGPDAPMPILTAAESYFLQAEAALNGLITGDVADLFNKGIEASFKYLYARPDGTYSGDYADIPGDIQWYKDQNEGDYLVDFSLATTNAEKLEAIITQKYIALNMVNSEEAWNDYRRTHYPTVDNSPAADGVHTFASTQSKSTRPDHLPTRILYPSIEGAVNATNMPKNIDPFSSLIFWAMQ
jgi:hypothetical protein